MIDIHLDNDYIALTGGVTKFNVTSTTIYSGNYTIGGVLSINGTLATGTKNNFTQTTSITTSVTVNGTSGYIITYNQNLSATTANTFTVNNSTCTSTSLVFLSILQFSSTAANLPVISSSFVSNGSFVVSVNNVTATAYSKTITKAYLVINQIFI